MINVRIEPFKGLTPYVRTIHNKSAGLRTLSPAF